MRVAIVTTGSPIKRTVADATLACAENAFPDVQLDFHDLCFSVHGHFAGADAARADAFVEAANDPAFDAVWFARGGYGAARIAEAIVPRLDNRAREKLYLGYSDAGTMLAALSNAGFPHLAHGPMPYDIQRDGGGEAVCRALAYLKDPNDQSVWDPAVKDGAPALAYNVTVLNKLMGTPLEPELAGRVLLLEEIDEDACELDRALFHLLMNPNAQRAAGVRMGRCWLPGSIDGESEIENEMTKAWCARAGIPYLGRCGIGHDSANMIVPFGGWSP